MAGPLTGIGSQAASYTQLQPNNNQNNQQQSNLQAVEDENLSPVEEIVQNQPVSQTQESNTSGSQDFLREELQAALDPTQANENDPNAQRGSIIDIAV